MHIRSIEKKDLDFNYLHLIDKLSPLPDFYGVDFNREWSNFINNDNHHTLVAISNDIVVGTGSLLVERKITGRIAGHIEDVVVLRPYRKKGTGAAIINGLIDIAKQEKCYKVILNCSDKNVSFYNKFGFIKIENGMKLTI